MMANGLGGFDEVIRPRQKGYNPRCRMDEREKGKKFIHATIAICEVWTRQATNTKKTTDQCEKFTSYFWYFDLPSFILVV
jgi:hypothetical protein